MGVVDTMVAGRIGPEAIAAVGLAATAYFMLFIGAYGTMLGLDPLVSRAVGASDMTASRGTLVSARWLAVLFCLPIIAGTWFAPDALRWMGEPEAVVAESEIYLAFVVIGILPRLLFHTYATYLTAHGHTAPFVLVTVVVNVVNLVCDVWFVNGGLGVPALGVAGIGAASAACRFVEFGFVLWWIRPGGRFAHLDAPWIAPAAKYVRRILWIGVPVGVQYLLEAGGFCAVTFLMGLKGELQLAGHQVALSFASVTFTVAMALSSAASVRVGQAYGRRDVEGVRQAGWTAFAVGFTLACGFAVLMWCGRGLIARAYINDPETVLVAAGFLAIAAVFQVADATQAIGFGVLRGLGDTRVPTTFNIVAYWLVGLPLGIWGAFVTGDRPEWLWWGLTIALVIVAAGLLVRFRVQVRRLGSGAG